MLILEKLTQLISDLTICAEHAQPSCI